MKRQILLSLFVILCITTMAQRDTLYLKGGQYFICHVTQHNNRTITYSSTLPTSTVKDIEHNARQSKLSDIITLNNGRKIICKIESDSKKTIRYSKTTDWNTVKSIHTANGEIITKTSTNGQIDPQYETKNTERRIQYSDKNIENIEYKPEIEELSRQGIIPAPTTTPPTKRQEQKVTTQTANYQQTTNDLQQQVNHLQQQVNQLQHRINELETEKAVNKQTTTPAPVKTQESTSTPTPTKTQETASTPAPTKAKPSPEAKKKAIAKRTGKNKQSAKHKNSKKTKKASAKNKKKKNSGKSSASTKRHQPANKTHKEEHSEQNETKTEVTGYSTLNSHVVGISIGYTGKWMQQSAWLQEQQTYTFMGNKPITSMLTIGLTYNPEFKHGIGVLTGINAELGYRLQYTNTLNWTQTHRFDACISVPVHLSYRYQFNDNLSLLLHTGPTLDIGIYNGGFTRVHNQQYNITYRSEINNQYMPAAQMLGKQQYEGLNFMWGYGIGIQYRQLRFEIGGDWGILNRYHFNDSLPAGVSPQSIRFHKPIEAKITYLF